MQTPSPSLTAVLLVTLGLLVGAPLGAPQVATPDEGTVVGSPTVSVVASDNRLTWGDGQTLTLSLANDGTLVRGGPERFESAVTTARSVRVAVVEERLGSRLAEGLTFADGPSLVGRVGRGEVVEVPLGVGVADDLRPGTYRLPLRVSYDYTATVRYGDGAPEYTDREASTLVFAEVVVADRPRLQVTDATDRPVAVGERGALTLTLSNTGTRTATDVGVSLETNVPVFFGGVDATSSETGVFVARLEPGASRNLTVPIEAHDSAVPSTYLVSATANYRTPAGFDRQVDGLRFGVTVVAGPSDQNAPETPS